MRPEQAPSRSAPEVSPPPTREPTVQRLTGRDLAQLSASAFDSFLEATRAQDVLARSDRRQIIGLPDETEPRRVAKIFEPRPRANRILLWIQRCIGLRPADREWRALTALHARGFPVPRPIERERLARNRDLLVLERIAGKPVADVLSEEHACRGDLLPELGRAVARLHALGFVHGDLHAGNWIVGPFGDLHLLDLQRTRRTRSARARLRDLADLDFSLQRHGVSLSARVDLRRAALGESRPLEAERKILAIDRLARSRAERHYKSRTRRTRRAGRLYKEVQTGAARGLRLERFSHAEVEAVLEGHCQNLAQGGEAVLKSDSRSRVTAVRIGSHRVVVKEVTKTGLGRTLADVFRGSPGRRAWVAGHGLRARGIDAATPFAFLESRSLGVPRSSLVILEDLRPWCPAHELVPERGPALSQMLLSLLKDLHRHGIVHGDLQAPHIFVDPRPNASPNPRLIDLEGVRFTRRLSRRQRIQALAELNASIPDDLIPNAERLASFWRYTRWLPFTGIRGSKGAQKSALDEIVRRSLARQHFWRGPCTEQGGPEALRRPSP